MEFSCNLQLGKIPTLVTGKTQELGGHFSKNSAQGRNSGWIFPGFVQVMGSGTILKNSTQEYGLQTHPGFGKGNFPKTLPREEIVVGFSRICADGGNHSQKLFPRKCFTDPPRNWNRKFPQNFSQARISDWIFPGHCRWEKN